MSRRFDGNFCENAEDRSRHLRLQLMKQAIELNQVNVLQAIWNEASG